MTQEVSEPAWIDVETAARILGVSGRSIRRACERGEVSLWRRVGFGMLRRRRYQVTLAEVRRLYSCGTFHETHLDNLDNLDR